LYPVGCGAKKLKIRVVQVCAIKETVEVENLIRIPTRFKTPAFRPEYAPPGPKGQGLRACSGGDANPSTPKSTGLKAGDKLVPAS
jgi:hypothetical protein